MHRDAARFGGSVALTTAVRDEDMLERNLSTILETVYNQAAFP